MHGDEGQIAAGFTSDRDDSTVGQNDTACTLFVISNVGSGEFMQSTQSMQDLGPLHWLLPSMVRDGLVKNGEWVLPAALEASALFADPNLQLPAQFLAVLDRYAIDAIKQAPVIVVAAASGMLLARRRDRNLVGTSFLEAYRASAKPAHLMRSYGLAPQLRAISSLALRRDQRDVLRELSDVLPASPLAQAIPECHKEQTAWLRGLASWRFHMSRHARDGNLFLDWAALHMRTSQDWAAATEIADFALHNREAFNVKWSCARAIEESRRWHRDLSLRPPDSEASRPDWRAIIDYAPLPAREVVAGFAFEALQTREALFAEGAHMHHCVRLYTEKVVRGSSRIYSVRRDDNRIATLELVRTPGSSAAGLQYMPVQIKGPYNARPAPNVIAAAGTFVKQLNKTLKASAPPATEQSLRADRVHQVLRGRLGTDLYASWFHTMEVEGFDGKLVQVSFPTKFLRTWIETHYRKQLLEACRIVYEDATGVSITLRSPAPIEAGRPLRL